MNRPHPTPTQDTNKDQATLLAIMSQHGATRERLINDLMAASMTSFKRLSVVMCRKANLDPRRHSDDITSIIALRAVMFIEDLTRNPHKLDTVISFTGYVATQARPDVRQYADSAASGERPSGAVGLMRRQREITKTRGALRAELDREPTDEEVITATNERMTRLRKDPQRQGMLVSAEDLSEVGNVPLADSDQDTPYEMQDGVLAPNEATLLIDTVVIRARATNPTLADVIHAWLGGVNDPALRSPRDVNEVARMLHLTPAAVAQHIESARLLASETLGELFGITSATA